MAFSFGNSYSNNQSFPQFTQSPFQQPNAQFPNFENSSSFSFGNNNNNNDAQTSFTFGNSYNSQNNNNSAQNNHNNNFNGFPNFENSNNNSVQTSSFSFGNNNNNNSAQTSFTFGNNNNSQNNNNSAAQNSSFTFGNNNNSQNNNNSAAQSSAFSFGNSNSSVQNSHNFNNSNNQNFSFPSFGSNAPSFTGFQVESNNTRNNNVDPERIRKEKEQKRLRDLSQQLQQQQDIIAQELQILDDQQHSNRFQFNFSSQNNNNNNNSSFNVEPAFTFSPFQSNNGPFNFQKQSVPNSNSLFGNKNENFKKKDRKPEFGNTVTLECPICLDFPLDISSTCCGHIFCEECINHHVSLRGNCPLCNEFLSLKLIHRIYLF